MDYLKVYTDCFNTPYYSIEHHIQYDFAVNNILSLYKNNSTFSLIDVGSGRGALINLVKSNFANSNITSVDLDKFNDIPVNFKKCNLSLYQDRDNLLTSKYDILTCTDVLEHLDKSFIEDVILMFSKLSKDCIFSIANHSDIVNNVQLHTIQENDLWWDDKLLKYFSITKKQIEYNGQLYMYVCKSKQT